MATEAGAGAARERLHWTIDVAGRLHSLDLFPAVARRSVSIDVDGLAVGRLPKPTPQQPWRETPFTVEGEAFVIGLTWHFPAMRTDVFVGGRSLLDGRTIEEARAAAPEPLGNYGVWVSPTPICWSGRN